MIKFLRILVLASLLLPGALLASPKILVLGDSLSAAYGIALPQGWVALLEKRLRDEGYPHTLVNASVSGETTAGGLARLPVALDLHKPEIVLIELGANDGLRGLSLKKMRNNLARMAQISRAAGAQALLLEMRVPPNYGAAYADEFQQSFARVAQEQKAVWVPFFLADIALKPEFFQDDGIHPTAEAQPRLLEPVWKALKPHLKTGRVRK
ncbi:MAG: arylesterase [Pseudomonadota bacterium]